jgi:Mn2+/Fe2+ NRAMP family transporter
VLLFAAVAGGSFRRWERFLFCLIALNVLIFPMAFLVHPSIGQTAAGLIPGFPGGLDSTLLLLIVSIVGITVAPWQLFFQQSNVVDKRITPRWIRYERADLRTTNGADQQGLAGRRRSLFRVRPPRGSPVPPIWTGTAGGSC